MQRKVQQVFVVLVVVVSLTGALRCPDERDDDGWWKHDGNRCILRCYRGYEPDGCHVLREKHGEWNHPVPRCVKESSVSASTVAAVATGIGAVIAAPFALPALGFGAGGVVAGSLAAWLQGTGTAAGSWFALSQSAGAAGMAVTTKAAIGGAATVAKAAYDSAKCERE